MNDYTITDFFDSTSPYFNGAVDLGSPIGAPNSFTDLVVPSRLAAGELQGNITVQDGFLQSSNFEDGASGWRIDSDGNATFVGISTLNVKAYTCFESSGRFWNETGGSGLITYGGGVLIDPGATASSYAEVTWYLSNYIWASNPNFSCIVECQLSGAHIEDGEAVFGLGTCSVLGSGITFNNDFLGFYFHKVSGVVTLYAVQSKILDTYSLSAALTTINIGDVFQLMVRSTTGVSADYYWRQNNGALNKVTLSGHVPGDVGGEYCTFGVTNSGTAALFTFNPVSASYER